MLKPLTEAERGALAPIPINPHPDGKPWTKCCGTKEKPSPGHCGCLCLTRKPANEPSRLDQILSGKFNYATCCVDLQKVIKEGGRFFCVHRTTDDGYHRECAGWAAKYGKDRL